MRRWVRATCALAMLLGGAHGAAASPSRLLTIDAPAAAYVDIRITRPVFFDLDGATMRGGGRYIGVVLDRIGDDRSIQLLHVRFPEIAAARDSESTLGFDQDEGRLPPGTYRLYALSDRPLRITIRVSGLDRNVRLMPSARVAPRYRTVDVPQPLDPAVGTPYGGLRRLPGVRSGPGELAIARFGVLFAPGTLTAEGWDFCVAPRGTECAQLPGFDGYVFGIASTGNSVDETSYLPPDFRPAGSYDVVAKCRAQEPARRCRAAVLDHYVSRARAGRSVVL